MNAPRPLPILSCLLLAALPVRSAATEPASQPTMPPAAVDAGTGDELRFNFRGAPLEQVLNYLSDAAGFVIILDTPVHGTVDMWSNQSVSRTEAVSLLNHALDKNGYTAVLQGRNLVVSAKDAAKRRNLPVRTGNDPTAIPPTADMVMQIIPLRQVSAAKIAQDIAPLIPESATVTPNEDSNSLIVTDTQVIVRHIVELVAQIDGSMSSESSMRVFPLKNADATEMTAVITSLFANPAGASGPAAQPGPSRGDGGTQSRIERFRSMMQDGGRGNSASPTAHTGTALVAVADARTNSVIVTGSRDALAQVADIVAQLDRSNARKQNVYVYTLENANVQQVETVLKNLFPASNNTVGPSTAQTDPLAARAATNTQQTSGSFLNNTGNTR